MLTVVIDQSEGISGADIPQQAVKKMRTGSAAPSLPSPCAFFVFPFTERLFTTISDLEQAIFSPLKRIRLHEEIRKAIVAASIGEQQHYF